MISSDLDGGAFIGGFGSNSGDDSPVLATESFTVRASQSGIMERRQFIFNASAAHSEPFGKSNGDTVYKKKYYLEERAVRGPVLSVASALTLVRRDVAGAL